LTILQVIGEVQLVARQGQLGKDENLRLFFRSDVGESNVLFEVCVDATPYRNRLSGGKRARACHVRCRPNDPVFNPPARTMLAWSCDGCARGRSTMYDLTSVCLR
jgi:hypothetical protein